MVSVSVHTQWRDHTSLAGPYRANDVWHIPVDIYLEIVYESDRYLTKPGTLNIQHEPLITGKQVTMVNVSARVRWWDHTFLVCPYRVDDKGHILVVYLEICYESDSYLTTAETLNIQHELLITKKQVTMVSVSAHTQWWDHTFLAGPYRVNDMWHIPVDIYLEICYESDRYLTTSGTLNIQHEPLITEKQVTMVSVSAHTQWWDHTFLAGPYRMDIFW